MVSILDSLLRSRFFGCHATKLWEFPHLSLGLLMTRHAIMITNTRNSKAAIINIHQMVLKNPPEKEMKYDKHCIDIVSLPFPQKFGRRLRRQRRLIFEYQTMKNSSFARFVPAFIIAVHFAVVLVQSTTANDLLFSCVDDASH